MKIAAIFLGIMTLGFLQVIPGNTEKIEGCSITEEGANAMCEAAHNLLKDQPENYVKMVCGCTKSFFTGDIKYCQTGSYDFPKNLNCGKLFNSDVFKKFVELSYKNEQYRKVINYVGKNVGVCNISDPDAGQVTKHIYKMFTSDMVISALDSLFEIAVTAEGSDLFKKCIHELSSIISYQKVE